MGGASFEGEDWFLQSDGASKQPIHAVNALLSLADKYPGMDMLCIGPLTNVALALRLRPHFLSQIGYVVFLICCYCCCV